MTKEKFLKAYSNLLGDERDEIIVIIDGKPYTWNRAYDQVSQNTELGNKIVNKMVELGLL